MSDPLLIGGAIYHLGHFFVKKESKKNETNKKTMNKP